MHECRSVGDRTTNRVAEMANVIRACNPFDFGLMFTLARNRFIGTVSHPINTVVDFIEAKSNLTIEFRSQQDGVGEPMEGSPSGVYDGCIGLLQRNESDFMTQLINYPMNAEGVNQRE